MDLMSEDFEKNTKIVYKMLETDPSQFVRNYKHQVFEDLIKQVHPNFASFKNILKIDLSQQLIGDENCSKLCNSIRRSPVELLNLSGNVLTDVGITAVAHVQRSLKHLKSLNLSWNMFTDSGLEALFGEHRYSSSLQELDISYNILNPISAFHLGFMFLPSANSCLSILRLGGTVSKKLWGDDFLRVLCGVLANNKLHRLKELHIPNFGITAAGYQCLATLLLCDDLINLDVLNISGNFVKSDSTKLLLTQAFSMSRAAFKLYANDCNFTVKDIGELQDLISNKAVENKSSDAIHRINSGSSSGSREYALAYANVKVLNQCHLESYHVKHLSTHTRRVEIPPKWDDKVFDEDITSSFSLRSTLSAKFEDFTDSWLTSFRLRVFGLSRLVYSVKMLDEMSKVLDNYEEEDIFVETNRGSAAAHKRGSIGSIGLSDKSDNTSRMGSFSGGLGIKSGRSSFATNSGSDPSNEPSAAGGSFRSSNRMSDRRRSSRKSQRRYNLQHLQTNPKLEAAINAEILAISVEAVAALEKLLTADKAKQQQWIAALESVTSQCNQLCDECSSAGRMLTLSDQQKESLLMAVEDALSLTVDIGCIRRQCIGWRYKMRLINTSRNKAANMSDKRWTYRDLVKTAIPFLDNIGILTSFVHYAFLVYSEDIAQKAPRSAQDNTGAESLKLPDISK